MKKAQIDTFGDPLEVVKCIDFDDVGSLGPDEVVFDVLLFPINYSDLMFCNGDYSFGDTPPLTPGQECVGRVVSVGANVRHTSAGDLIMPMFVGTWTQRAKVRADLVVKLPEGIDLKQA